VGVPHAWLAFVFWGGKLTAVSARALQWPSARGGSEVAPASHEALGKEAETNARGGRKVEPGQVGNQKLGWHASEVSDRM